MKSGPKPVSPQLRALRGGRTRPRHADAPRALQGEPLKDVPKWLQEEAAKVWEEEIVPAELPQWQEQSAAQYCTSLIRWKLAMIELEVEGEILETPAGIKYRHPLSKLVKELGSELRELKRDLGLQREVTPMAGDAKKKQAAGQNKQRFFKE